MKLQYLKFSGHCSVYLFNFWWLPLFYVNCETSKPPRKPLKNSTNEKKEVNSPAKSFASNNSCTSHMVD